MKKTVNFAAIHFTIAFTVAYVLTGDILLGSLMAMVEPSINSVAFYFHERAWGHFASKARNLNNARLKTLSFASIHFSIAFSVSYLLTGDWLVGGIMATIEPCFNTLAYYFHEKIYQRKQQAQWLSAH